MSQPGESKLRYLTKRFLGQRKISGVVSYLGCSIFSHLSPAELFALARKDLDTKDHLSIESFLTSCFKEGILQEETALAANPSTEKNLLVFNLF